MGDIKYIRSSRQSGFTIAEALFIVSLITLIYVITFAFQTGKNETAGPIKLKEDFAAIEAIVYKYQKLKNEYPCHVHNMSSNNEKEWSSVVKEPWPISPSDTTYFISHTGREDKPTLDDMYYIGVPLFEKEALKFDQMYDDGNLDDGRFSIRHYPLQHYSYNLSFATFDNHRHCQR